MGLEDVVHLIGSNLGASLTIQSNDHFKACTLNCSPESILTVNSGSVSRIIQYGNLASIREILNHHYTCFVACLIVISSNKRVNETGVKNLRVKIDNNNTGLSHHINSNTRCCRVNRIVENYIATLCNKIFDNTLLISCICFALTMDDYGITVLFNNRHEAVIDGIKELRGCPFSKAKLILRCGITSIITAGITNIGICVGCCAITWSIAACLTACCNRK